MALAVLGGIAGGVVAATSGPSRDSRFLKALHQANLTGEYPNDDAAVAHAKAFCRGLADGHAATGWDSEQLAVRYYCKSFLPGFKVVPTPAQLQAKYLSALRDGGYGGTFASDAAAVAHARSICARLRGGGAQQGLPVDQVAVENYCPEFASGFHVLQTRTFHGHFTLIDTSGDFYFPSIDSLGGGQCSGDNGYSDIGPGTEVTITNGAGHTLAQTQLGEGRGGSSFCTFSFSVRLTEGESDYSVTVSHRGNVDFTWSQLTNRGIRLTLGS